MKSTIREAIIVLLALGSMFGLAGLASKAHGQAASNGWERGNGFEVRIPTADPTGLVSAGRVLIYENLDGGISAFPGSSNKAYQIPMVYTACGSLADAGGSGKSNATVTLPYGNGATCQCNETTYATSGVAAGLGAAVTSSGGTLVVTGGSITSLDNYCCTCSGS
jgi:hypothetical protein